MVWEELHALYTIAAALSIASQDINLTRNILLTTCAWSTLLNLNISVHSTKVCLKDAVYKSSWKTNQATYDFACTKMAEAKLNQVEDHTAEKGSV